MENNNPFGDTRRLPTVEVFGHRAYAERRLPDALLGTWETSALPDDAVLTHVTLAPYRGERPVLTWRQGRLWLLEGEVASGEDADVAVSRVAMEQAGIAELKARHLGHLRCRATVNSQKQADGTVTYRVLYAVEVAALADAPTDATYERRIVNQRDMNELIRSHYVELRREYMEALDDFVLERIKEAAAQGTRGA